MSYDSPTRPDPRRGRLDVVLTGIPETDAAARGWAVVRARATGAAVGTIAADDLPTTDARLAVVGRHTGEGDDAAGRLLALSSPGGPPLVAVAVDGPHHSLTELADTPRLPVTVGVPDEHAEPVLDLAADEARATGTDLVVTRVWRESGWLSSADRAHTAQLRDSRIADARLVDRAVLHVHHRHPDLDVMSELRDGSVYEWLGEISRRTACVVLGTGPGGDSALTRWAVEHVGAPLVLVAVHPVRASAGSGR